ncbi:cyclase family protein [Candidatus Bodocaedibacter vickermanii]|uniref:Kynurenine formamidase n=1 Tax=Candidatus Bodocaedibacter vickermanii TaxID=2741701 RepID=A0A7L9RS47_9PROT|nr:Kynurenine formamidase [Candidatus Paracaedibacteraceae bacterium 'Lake Konstanz']
MPAKLIDLTHALTEKTPTWDGRCGFHLTIEHDYLDDQNAVSFKVQRMSLDCGIGTHIDAPAHCIKNAMTIDQIPLNHLVNIPGYGIDISNRLDQDNCLTANDIFEFEATHGTIQENSCVLINTGWHQYWEDASHYHNKYRFPYIHTDAGELLAQRKIRALGIDTLSPDRPDSGYPIHSLLLSRNILIVENVNNLSQLPSKDFNVTIAPLNIQNATESPIRMWASNVPLHPLG